MKLMTVTTIKMDAENQSSLESMKLFLNCSLVTSDCVYELADAFDCCVNELFCAMLEIQMFTRVCATMFS